MELYEIARDLLFPEQPRADNALAILDHPVAYQVFEALQTLNPRPVLEVSFGACMEWRTLPHAMDDRASTTRWP